MKKIDLHIHTVSTFSDRAFEYSLDSFKAYVEAAKLDAVAVTNHDVFDADQFEQIQADLPAVVFPGIEINVEQGHLLVIARPTDLSEFRVKTALVANKIRKIGDRLTVSELQNIFGDLSRYLLIPHYDKGPSIAGPALEQLRPYVSAGEVDSAKKFIRNIKDSARLPPVLFSDARMMKDLRSMPTRQTFVDCGEITLDALKICLADKSKIALSPRDGNALWQALPNGQMLSTGLNVVVGGRSSGKTHTLDLLSQSVKSVKYIKQLNRPGFTRHMRAAGIGVFRTLPERRRQMCCGDAWGCRTSRCS